MFPLYDENRFRGRPFVTWALIAVNVLVFVWELNSTELFVNEAAILKILQNYGVTPASFAGAISFDILFTLISSMFLHGGFLHIIGNMVFLYIFGDNIEAKFGHVKFLLLYIIFGLAGAFCRYSSPSFPVAILPFLQSGRPQRYLECWEPTLYSSPSAELSQ